MRYSVKKKSYLQKWFIWDNQLNVLVGSGFKTEAEAQAWIAAQTSITSEAAKQASNFAPSVELQDNGLLFSAGERAELVELSAEQIQAFEVEFADANGNQEPTPADYFWYIIGLLKKGMKSLPSDVKPQA